MSAGAATTYVNHPAADLMPMLGESDLAALAADIRANGLHEPVVLFDGQVLDGRNRLAACRLAGVEPTFRTLESCADPVGFVLSVNVRRRHLSTSQLAMVGGRVARSLNLDSGRSDETAAKMVGGVERASVAMAISVLKHGTPELIALVDRNDLAVSVAAKAAKLPTDQQRELVARGPDAMREAVKAEVKPREGKVPAPPSDTAAPSSTTSAPAAPVAGAGVSPQHPTPTPLVNLTSHPAVDAIASAPTRDALEAAYTAANGARLSAHDAEEAGKVYQRKVAELRAQAPATTPTEPTHEQVDLFTQAAPAAPSAPRGAHEETAAKEASPASFVPPTVPAADASEVAALRAKVEAYRAWINGLCEYPVSNGAVNLDKVRRLIALSRSPNENEARNAAALACKAICDAGLVVISADDPRLNGSGTDLDMAALKRSMTDAFVDIFNMARAARVHP